MYYLRGLVSQDFDIIISSMHAPSIYSALALFGNKKSKFIICEESSSMAPILFFVIAVLSFAVADYLSQIASMKLLIKKFLVDQIKSLYLEWL